jgi:hypothetical protein
MFFMSCVGQNRHLMLLYIKGKRIEGVVVRDPTSGQTAVVKTNAFVLANGPFLKHLGRKIGVELPVINELHARVCWISPAVALARQFNHFDIYSAQSKIPKKSSPSTALSRYGLTTSPYLGAPLRNPSSAKPTRETPRKNMTPS